VTLLDNNDRNPILITVNEKTKMKILVFIISKIVDAFLNDGIIFNPCNRCLEAYNKDINSIKTDKYVTMVNDSMSMYSDKNIVYCIINHPTDDGFQFVERLWKYCPVFDKNKPGFIPYGSHKKRK
jgi:hypothetical protein